MSNGLQTDSLKSVTTEFAVKFSQVVAKNPKYFGRITLEAFVEDGKIRRYNVGENESKKVE